ncbi:MAG: adenylate/guanylate cyclase domain-containing protein [Magnetococcales bacterium]|nr:adenylate/guanylate cyclase domain-containing protein [Magnetococcales bacterium]
MRRPRDWRGFVILAVIALLSAWLSRELVQRITVLNMLEQWTGDMRIGARPAEPQHPEIIIVSITEETLETFPYRAPIDRKFLSDLLQTLEKRGARAILLDILLDQPTEPDKDAAMKATLAGMRIPTVVSYVHGNHQLTPRQSRFLDDFVPARQRGLANVVRDQFDNTVRWIFPGATVPDQGYIRGVAGVMASLLGIAPPDDLITLAWHGRPDSETEPFRTYPAHTVTLLPEAWFAQKIILIGADLSLTDRHRTPLSSSPVLAKGLNQYGTPGVMIHAHALAHILDRRPTPDLGKAGRGAMQLLSTLPGLLLAAVELGFQARLILAMVLTVCYWIGAIHLFAMGGPLLPLLAPTLAFILALGSGDLYLGRDEREQRKFIKNAFRRYLAPAVVEQLLNDRASLRLGGERREMTFIFTDVADFTPFSETMEATELTNLLNRYFNGMCQIILRHEGTVINFVGDALFALFGAPARQDDHPRRALACAMELDAFAQGFRQRIHREGIPFGETRIGVHTGHAAIGNMGSEERFQYTSLGDAVNTAARLEGFNKFVGTRICVSEKTIGRCPGFHARPIAEVVLKGKSHPIATFEPLTAEQADTPDMRTYREAYALLTSGQVAQAQRLLAPLASRNAPDPCALFHLRRLEAGAQDTLVQMDSK